MKGKYNFDLLVRHSNSLSLESRRIFKNEMKMVREGFRLLDSLWAGIHETQKGHYRNVRLALLARFTNHLLSQTTLAERGLLLDAINAARSATETTAFYWLICVSPDDAAKYDAEISPRPVEVRRDLEKRGVDVSDLREKYGLESTASHVGNRTDNWQINWISENNGLLMIGGGMVPDLQRILLKQVFSTRLASLSTIHSLRFVGENGAEVIARPEG
jgi:antitoxin component HigA of HigAB toxin-antitoxin module